MMLTLVHNPGAGDESLSKEKLLRELRNRNLEVTYISSKDENFSEAVQSSSGNLFLVAGGDGTVGKVARLLADKPVYVAIMPLGTANNIVKSLGEPVPVAGSYQEWMKLEKIPFDLSIAMVADEEKSFVESLGCGILAALMHEFDQKRDQEQLTFDQPEEKIKYTQTLLEALLSTYPANYYDITIDGKRYSGKYLLVEVMNIQSVGPRLRLAPEASPGDGYLDVVLIHEHERELLQAYLASLRRGEDHAPAFTVRRGKEITLNTTIERFHIDDRLLPERDSSQKTLSLDVWVESTKLQVFNHAITLP